ncbi:MAG TPA: polysaccharide deacetylase family protein [Candidatus Acidoferrum sp.]|nr:polysaccharide deacetylase family protein [Candidatus Acidoferrum sp.]
MSYTMAAAAATAIGFAGSSAYLSPWVWRQHYMNRARTRVVENRTLALTYDDGPNSEITPQLLDLLKSRGARATFFLLGRHAQQCPEIVDRISREGHDIGCHSDQHLNAWKVMPWTAIADIEAGYKHLSPWIRSNGMFRPPYGKMTLPTYLNIRRRGAPVWWWTINSSDTFKVLPHPNEVVEKLRQEGGGIVLMHDGSAEIRAREKSDFTLEVTRALLDVAEQESLKVVGLSELCK